MYTNYITPTTD